MWQVLVAAAVAGSGLVARNVFNSDDGCAESVSQRSDQRSVDRDARSEIENSSHKSESDELKLREESEADNVFRFSSPGYRTKKNKFTGNPGKKTKKKQGVEVGKLERRFSVCLKRRKTRKNVNEDSGACWSNGNPNSLFGCGFGAGILYVMSTGQAELSKLNATMDTTVKAVGELKHELRKRKASCVAKSICPSDRSIYEDGEYPSSILTEEPEPRYAIQEMDQLEADLEYELSKLTSCATEVSFDKKIDSELYQTEVLANGGQQRCNSYQFSGVEPSVLDKKLSQLLIQQQESQISELEYELQSANVKLHQKEAELRALKDFVKRLSNFSLSDAPGNENETAAEEMVDD